MCSSCALNCADTVVGKNSAFSISTRNSERLDNGRCPFGPAGRDQSAVRSIEALRIRSVIEACVRIGFAPAPEIDVLQKRRWQPFAHDSRGSKSEAFARQAAMYLAHVAAGLPYSAAGQLFGRDRTTAAHACAVVEDRRDDPVIDLTMATLEPAVRLRIQQSMPCSAPSNE